MLLGLGLNERCEEERLVTDRQQVCLLIKQRYNVIVILNPEKWKNGDTYT